MKDHRRFYDDGIRFQCQGDGKCCLNHGRHMYVYVGFGDRRRLALHLGMSVPEFMKRYTAASDGMVHLKDPERDCPFFRDNRCGVHEARPWQCRTWPFWPENMKPAAWREVCATCRGIGRGRRYSPEEIRAILADQEERDG